MSETWISLSDDVTLGASDQIRIAVSFYCTPFSSVTAADIRTFLSQDKDVLGVLDVQEGWLDSVTLGLSFSCRYIATVNPANGSKAGDLRGAMYQAIQKANDTHVIKSDQVLVGDIQKKSVSIIPSLTPAPSTAISLTAIAVIAVVLLVVFLKLD
jgi:hypothetical protein